MAFHTCSVVLEAQERINVFDNRLALNNSQGVSTVDKNTQGACIALLSIYQAAMTVSQRSFLSQSLKTTPFSTGFEGATAET